MPQVEKPNNSTPAPAASTAAVNSDALFATGDIDLNTILRDIRKNIYGILCLAIAIGLLAFIFFDRQYSPTYTSEATYAVTSIGANNNVFENLNTASNIAYTFSQMASGKEMREIVAADMGAPVSGSISASYIENTNLMNLRVTSGSPLKAFQIIQSTMNNIQVVLDYLEQDVRLNVLVSPSVATTPNAQSSAPEQAVKVFLAALAGLIFIVAFYSYRKDTIRKGSDVAKKLETKYLGSVPHEDKRITLRSRLKKRQLSMLITRPTVSFNYTEGYHKICRKVMSRMRHHEAKTLMVTSVSENEGKSTVSANLALAMAEEGKRVLLMDLDMRKPSQYHIFHVDPSEPIEEIGDYLEGKENKNPMIRMLSQEKLYVIFNTRTYPQSAEILSNGRLEELLKYLRERFDYIIIDTPPMSVVADAEVIAGCADMSLVVVKEHKNSARVINEALDTLRDSKAEPAGCVLNDVYGGVSEHIGGYQYGSDYGYRYGKGYGRYYGRYTRANQK